MVVLLIVLKPVMVVRMLMLVYCLVLLMLYLLSLGLLKGELQGGHGQLVGKEVNISGQLERADSRRRAVPSSDTAEQLPLPERNVMRRPRRGRKDVHVVSRRPDSGLQLYPVDAIGL